MTIFRVSMKAGDVFYLDLPDDNHEQPGKIVFGRQKPDTKTFWTDLPETYSLSEHDGNLDELVRHIVFFVDLDNQEIESIESLDDDNQHSSNKQHVDNKSAIKQQINEHLTEIRHRLRHIEKLFKVSL